MNSRSHEPLPRSDPKVSALIVDAKGLLREYGPATNPVVALAAATCQVYAGQQIALIGPSGSGKSTLLHLLAGLDTPTSGTITWPSLGDRSTLRPGPIGVVFQAPSLLPSLTVVENVALPLLLKGDDPSSATRDALAALALLDLDALANKLPEELSGGQAQRVAIARVLAAEPVLILADEPTGQLDRSAGAHVIDMLIAASDATGAALVINTHDPAIADRLAIHWSMRDGTLSTGSTETPTSGSTTASSQASSLLESARPTC